VLGEAYEVTPVDLSGEEPSVPDTVDALVVGKPGALSKKQQFAIDQYLMRGGRVIALAGSHGIALDRSGLRVETEPTALSDMLAKYGVKVGAEFVVDSQNAPFPRPVEKRVGGMVLRSVELEPYPFFVDVRQGGFERGHAATAGVGNITFPWGSPLEVTAPEGVTATVVAKTSDQAWTYAGTELEPPAQATETKSYPVAVVLTGRIPSAFKDAPNPYVEGDASAAGADAGGRTVKESVPDARLAVVGSSELVSDLMLQLATSPGGEVHRANVQFLQNLVDWSTEDTDLLEIRSAGAFARTLEPLDDETRNLLELAQYGLAVVLLLGVAGVARARRRAVVALPLKVAERTA
jgi:ABC-2 type transport system permease protein